MTAQPPIERSHSEQSTQNKAVGSDSVGINFGTNPFSQIEGPEVQSAPPYLNLEEGASASGKKRKQSQMASKLGEFIDLRKIQMEKNQEKLDEKKKKEDDYSVEKCIAVVDTIEDLTIEQKADANELFQSEMNRQIFMMTKNPAVRLVWLKKKISQVCLLVVLVFFSCSIRSSKLNLYSEMILASLIADVPVTNWWRSVILFQR